MRLLIISSRESVFTHGSGEVESFLLKIGFQLLGYECDFIGLESRDFEDYDAYLLFSMCEDVLEYIDHVSIDKYCILFPQVDVPNNEVLQRIRHIGKTREKFLTHSRNLLEDSQYSSAVKPGRLLKERGWFVKPFVHQADEPDNTNEILTKSSEYILLFSAYGRDDGLRNVIEIAESKGKEVVVVTDALERHRKQYDVCSNVRFMSKVKYGSYQWFMLMKNMLCFYEPNPRVTCSVLEALWLRKAVLSCNAEAINSLMGDKFVLPLGSDLPSKIDSDVDLYKLAKFDARYVARNIIDRIAL